MGTAYGRHVVVSFTSVADAEEFVAALKVEGAVFFMGVDTHFKNIDVGATQVLGLFAKPNSFCECDWGDGEKKYVRGSKYGLYVHDKCLKPEGGHLQSAPKNLLYPPDMDPREKVEQDAYVGLTVREGRHNWPVPKHRETLKDGEA